MKFRNILAVAAVALLATSVAFGQMGPTTGTTTYSVPCGASSNPLTPPGTPALPTVIPACQVTGQTLLVANFSEGLTLTIPNQINFSLVPGFRAPGSQPLTAVTTWVLDNTYSFVYVDAYFPVPDSAMPASLQDGTMGTLNAIPASAILAQQNGNGGTSAFGSPTTMLSQYDPFLIEAEASNGAVAFPIANVALVGSTTLGGSSAMASDFVGQDSSYLNLWIDFTAGSPLSAAGAILPNATGTWKGYVYVRAQAF